VGLLPDGRGRTWTRSIGAAALDPQGVLRDAERRHLRDVWSDHVDAVVSWQPPGETSLVTDGGERR
jgi:hypothetical protein